MNSKFHAVLLLATFFWLPGCAYRAAPEIREFTPQSEFIFVGTVQLTNSSTLMAGDVKNLAVVQIDKILRAPAIFQGRQKEQITVKMQSLKDAEVGQQRLFFTNGWLFAESLAVVEVGSSRLADSRADIAELRSQVEQVVQDTREKALSERLARASVVVYGTVTAVAKDPNAVPMITEHDPDWWTATIAVESVLKGLKGKIPKATLKISFAHSMDVVWANAPKPKKGDLGIWILHEEFPGGLKAPHPAPFESEDFRPRDDLDLIRRLVR